MEDWRSRVICPRSPLHSRRFSLLSWGSRALYHHVALLFIYVFIASFTLLFFYFILENWSSPLRTFFFTKMTTLLCLALLYRPWALNYSEWQWPQRVDMAWGAEPLSYPTLRVQGCFLWQRGSCPQPAQIFPVCWAGGAGTGKWIGFAQTALYPEAVRKSPLVAFLTTQGFSNLSQLNN